MRKLSEVQIAEIRKLYATGRWSQPQLARLYKINVATIWAHLNKEKAAERQRRYREANHEKIAEQQKRYRKRYRANNHEKISERGRRYYANNRERILEYTRQYYANNHEAILERHKQTIIAIGSQFEIANEQIATVI